MCFLLILHLSFIMSQNIPMCSQCSELHPFRYNDIGKLDCGRLANDSDDFGSAGRADRPECLWW